MIDDLPWFGPEPDDRVPKKCRHPRWQRVKVYDGILLVGQKCESCGHLFDEADRRRGRNNRSRGNAAELDVARALGGRKMGPLGMEWDVEARGKRFQVKKLATPPSLRYVIGELDRIGERAGFVWIEPGRGGEALVVLRLRDYASEGEE